MVGVGMLTASISAFALMTRFVTVSAQKIGAFDPSTMHPRALATSSSTYTYCEAESLACQEDASCLDCYFEYGNMAGGCMDVSNCDMGTQSGDYLVSSTDYFLSCSGFCEDLDNIVSCAVAAKDECANNDVFDTFVGCIYSGLCSGDLDTGTSSGATTPTTTDEDDSNTSDPVTAGSS
ncbi:unnamed protein product, partial [Pylaiella littoralis]